MLRLLNHVVEYYLFDDNKEIMKHLGKELDAEPFRVYRLSRGARCRSYHEMKILYRLRDEGIIKRIKFM